MHDLDPRDFTSHDRDDRRPDLGRGGQREHAARGPDMGTRSTGSSTAWSLAGSRLRARPRPAPSLMASSYVETQITARRQDASASRDL
jgi:hypothetical protein